MAQKNLQVDEVTLKSRAKNKQIRIMDSLSQPNEEKRRNTMGQSKTNNETTTSTQPVNTFATVSSGNSNKNS